MGGRGASSGGRSGRAPRGYRTIGKAHRIPIIKSYKGVRVGVIKTHGKIATVFLIRIKVQLLIEGERKDEH